MESAIVPSSNSSGGDTVLIQRGREMLSELNRELLIAKAEKTRTLLTQAIAAAEHGDLSALQEILTQQAESDTRALMQSAGSHPHFTSHVRDDHESDTKGPGKSSSSAISSLFVADNSSGGAGEGIAASDPWSQLLPVSVQRNVQRGLLLQENRSGTLNDAAKLHFPRIPAEHSSASTAGAISPRLSASVQAKANRGSSDDTEVPAATSHIQTPRETFDFLTHTPKETFSDASIEEIEPERPISEDILSISKSLELELGRNEAPSESKVLARGATVATVSLVFHILLGVSLAFVTLNLPMPKGTMLFEASASDSATDTFELSEAVEASEPTEVTEPTEETLPTTDLATDLSDVSDMSFEGPAVAAPKTTPAASAMKAQATSGSSARAAASFFGAAATGNCICFVIDASPTMKGGPWDAATNELFKSLSSMSPKQRFYIVCIDSKTSALPLPGETEPAGRALYATPENVNHAKSWVRSLDLNTTASPVRALTAALETEPDAIYFLADGITTVDLVGELRKKNRSQDLFGNEQVRTAIHTIAFYAEEKGIEVMRRVAADNRGQFIYVPNPVPKSRKR